MNLREFVKKLRSPMGTTILFLSGLVILILLLLPMLLRDDAGKLEVNRPAGGEGTFDINMFIPQLLCYIPNLFHILKYREYTP